MGKHSPKRKLETAPPRELGTVPLLGGKNAPQGGTENNCPVVQLLTFHYLLVAAVKPGASKKGGTGNNFPKVKKWYRK